MRDTQRAVMAFAALAWTASCASPPSPPAGAAPEASVAGGRTAARDADATFMQRMILHHAQALAMTRLVPARATAADIRTLAERIDVSQREEIGLMERWLMARGLAVPDTTHVAMGHHVPGDTLMPGMLTADQLRALETGRGPAFARLFLELMIQHHRGALTMVRQLRAAGGGQDPEVFRFASDVDADQRAEIARMQRLLDARASP